jgi:hypothetical protein
MSFNRCKKFVDFVLNFAELIWQAQKSCFLPAVLAVKPCRAGR